MLCCLEPMTCTQRPGLAEYLSVVASGRLRGCRVSSRCEQQDRESRVEQSGFCLRQKMILPVICILRGP